MGSTQVKNEKAKEIVDQSVTRSDYDSSWSMINLHGESFLSGLIFTMVTLLIILGGFSVYMWFKWTASTNRNHTVPNVPNIQTTSLAQIPIYDVALPRLSLLDERWRENNRSRANLARRISKIHQRSLSNSE